MSSPSLSAAPGVTNPFAAIDADPAGARATLREHLRHNPEDVLARRGLARALRKLGDDSAMAEENAAIAQGIERASYARAADAFAAGNLEDAEVAIRAHLRSDPHDPAAILILAKIAARCDAPVEAERMFDRAIVLAPTYLVARMALATFQRERGRFDDALATLDGVLARQADHLDALRQRAAIYEQLRRLDEADAALNELHQYHPGDAQAWSSHAHLLKSMGRREDAIAAYRRSLENDAGHALSWWGLANMKSVHLDESDIAQIRGAFGSENQTTDDRVHLHYALGKALGDSGDYAGSFAAYSAGAKLRLAEMPYDPKSVDANVARNKATFTPAFVAEREGWGAPARDPVFIISLPRSGSTLLEQILASHPMIEGTEELHDIERIAVTMAREAGKTRWLDVLPDLDAGQVHTLGEHYVETTRRVRQTDKPMFTDKMPSNWIYTGLIHTILPNAKIVSIRRHPMSCGFANFAQHFAWGIKYSYDLEHIAGFYAAFVRQMAHFDRVLPGRIHHVSYENLVENTDDEVRRLLDYLEVPFDEACLRFHENRRAVFTPSSEQVRTPINREGMERWRNYEPFLDPLAKALGPVLDHYPDPPPGY